MKVSRDGMSDCPKPGKSGAARRNRSASSSNQTPEHVARGWEAVQQEDRWCASHAGFSIENLELVNVCCAVSNLGPGDRPILLSLHKESLAHGCFPLLPA
jgi:hypothetical protein